MDHKRRSLERQLSLEGSEVKVISLLAYQGIVLYLFRARFRGEATLRWMNDQRSEQQHNAAKDRLAETLRLLEDLGGCFRDHTVLLATERCSICFCDSLGKSKALGDVPYVGQD